MPSTTPSLINRETALAILSGELPLYRALSDAAEAREKYFGKTVRIQILDNIKNGACAENCCYCAQRSNATGVENYPLKDAEAIFADAQAAKEAGAYRFCMVTSGTAPSMNTTEKLTRIIRRITEELNLRVCLSAGFLDLPKAVQLKEAGLDRYNHNLNTSE
ncbi:MAG TPA: radical SAM protein, partial [Turneriella sp.]|nr:radical SAM protein [Turneriella sp.]